MKNRLTEIKWGVVWPTSVFLFLCFEFFAGLQEPPHLEWGMWIDMLGGLVLPLLVFGLGLRQKRDQDLEGRMSWQEGFRSGLLITLISLPLSVLLVWAFLTFVNPHFFRTMIEYGLAMGYDGEAHIRAYFSMKPYLTQTAISTLLLGVILSAVFAFLFKTK